MPDDNLKLWNSVADTDADFCKKFTVGERGSGLTLTEIDATYAKRRGTELWGPYGATWGLKNLIFTAIAGTDGVPLELWLQATFFWPGGSFEIAHSWPWRRAGNTHACLQTHVLKKAMHYLGFFADVYLGRFDETDQQAKRSRGSTGGGGGVGVEQTASKIIEALNAAKDVKTLDRYYKASKSRGLPDFWLSRIDQVYAARSSEMQQKETF